jgi:hypothetical protein
MFLVNLHGGSLTVKSLGGDGGQGGKAAMEDGEDRAELEFPMDKAEMTAWMEVMVYPARQAMVD